MPIYRDSYGNERRTLEEFALWRASTPAALLGGAQCPAVEYTFAVSDDDDGQRWRGPTDEERCELVRIVTASEHCCRDLGDDCPLRSEPGPD